MENYEEKQLLLKDLSGRLLYGVKCQTKNGIGTLISVEHSFGENLAYVDFGFPVAEEYDLNDGDTVKPYLRPMSSMTDEETKYKLSNFFKIINTNIEGVGYKPTLNTFNAIRLIDWLNKNMFDYRGLIEKGLALEAPEGMYKID